MMDDLKRIAGLFQTKSSMQSSPEEEEVENCD